RGVAGLLPVGGAHMTGCSPRRVFPGTDVRLSPKEVTVAERVPALAWWPGQIPAGTRAHDRVGLRCVRGSIKIFCTLPRHTSPRQDVFTEIVASCPWEGQRPMPLKLSAFPKCYIDQIAGERSLSVFDWIEMARSLDADGLELYDGFFTSLDTA